MNNDPEKDAPMFQIKDLTGLGEPITKLLDIVQKSVGTLFEPTQILRIAKAEAKGLKVLEQAKTEAKIDAARTLAAVDPAVFALIADVPLDLVQRAQMRVQYQEVVRHRNLEHVVAEAAMALPNEVSEEPVDLTFATRFFGIAAEVSDEQMRALFGKLLAGEVTTPGRFTVRTLEVLRNMTHHEAEIFRKACSLSSGGKGRFIIEIPDDEPHMVFSTDEDALKSVGFSYSDRMALADAGLLYSQSAKFAIRLGDGEVGISNNGKYLVFAAVGDSRPVYDCVRPGWSVLYFTPAGVQLSSLMDDSFQDKYVELLDQRYRGYGLKVSVTIKNA